MFGKEREGWICLTVEDYEARIERINPFESSDREWTADEIEHWLVREQVTHGLLSHEFAELVEKLNRDRLPVYNVVVAIGQPPVEEGWLQHRHTGNIVLPGETIATFHEPRNGMTVRGETVPPAPGSPKSLRAGKDVAEDSAAKQMRALVYGRVTFQRKQVSVDRMIHVINSGMAAQVDLVTRTTSGLQMEMEHVHAALAAEGIVFGIQDQAIVDGLASAREQGNTATGILVAQGAQPVNGIDGRLEFLFDIEQKIGLTGKTGQIDFRERNTVQNVQKGDVICRLILPLPDKPGTDIYGQTARGEKGRDARVAVLENITFDDKKLEYVAQISGGLILTKNKLAVTPNLIIDGDVDLSSGNLHADTASVHVRGNILDLFEVNTSGAVTVDGGIGDAIICAGGQVVVGGGVVMKGKGRIEAGGTVSARFFQNATVIAGGDILIGNSAINCQLEAGGRILALNGKGRIIGGMVKAQDGVLAKTIGSEMEVLTELVVEQHVAFVMIRNLKNRFRNESQEIGRLIGQDPLTDERLSSMPAPKRSAIQALISYQLLAQHNLENLNKLRDLLFEACKSVSGGVTATSQIYPGARVTILDRTWEIETPLLACRISYEAGKAVMASSSIPVPEGAADNPGAATLEQQRQKAEILEIVTAMGDEADRLDLPRSLKILRGKSRGGLRVLVADDHRLTRAALRRLLANSGFTVLEYAGQSVVHSILEQSVNLVLLDIDLGGSRSGLDTLKDIKAHPDLTGLPVIMMTVHKEKSIIQAAMASKADDLIIKPFDDKVLISKVTKALNKIEPTVNHTP